MTRFPERNLNQKVVYWGGPENDGAGTFTWSEDPIEIDCRWEEKVEVIKSADGSEITSTAQIQVAQDLEEEGMILLGTLDSLSDDELADPVEAGASQIQAFSKLPTIKSGRFYRLAYI